MTPVVELLRVSTESQAHADRAGLPAQHATNVRTAELHGLSIVESVQIIESGASVAESPSMQRVLDFIRSGAARGIVLAEYSRLFRPERWSDFAVLQTLSDHGAQIYLPSGPIDLQSEIGYVQATINNLLAGLERKRIRERMDRGKEEHRRRGAHVGGGIGIPFGLAYSKQDGWTYTPDIECVRELFRLFLAGEHRIYVLADAVGLSRSSARYMLQNPIYTGWRVYDERRDLSPAAKLPSGDRRRRARAEHEIIRARLPLAPVVSEHDFAFVQAVLAENTRRRTPRADHAQLFLYRGFMRCAHDDQLIYGHQHFAKGRQIPRYACRTRSRKSVPNCPGGYMTVPRLEAILDGVVADQLTDAGLIVAALESYAESIDAGWRTARPHRTSVEAQLRELRARRARVLDLYIAGHIDAAERERRMQPITAETVAAERLLAIEPAALPAGLTQTTVEQIVGTFAEWRFLGWQQRRDALDALSPTFYVSRYSVEGVRFPFVEASYGQPLSSGGRSSAPVSGLYIPLRGIA